MSPGISPGDDKKSPRDLLAGRGGLHSRPSLSPGILPGDDKKSRPTSLREKTANTFGRHRRTAYRPPTPRSPAQSLRGTRRPAFPALNVARHLTRRRQEVLSDLRAGRGGPHCRPLPSPGISPGDEKKSRATLRGARQPTPLTVAVARHLLGDEEVPARLLRGAQPPTLSAVTVAWHLARRRQEVPPDL